MKKVLDVLFVMLFVTMSFGVKAMPAYPHPIKFTQPDGSTLTIRVKGDEYINWRETIDNYTLMFNNEGYLTYAIHDSNGDLNPSDVIATDVEKRGAKVNSFLVKVEKGLFYSKEQSSIMAQLKDTKQRSIKQAQETSIVGKFNALCVLVEFPERSLQKTKADFEHLMNDINYAENGAAGSVKDYFLESSYGQFELTMTIAGPYKAPKAESYYAGKSGADNGYELAYWVAMEADADVDFSEFDGDKNGTVDNFHLIFAGYGQEAGGGATSIWSHSSAFPSVKLDGMNVGKYSCSPELQGGAGSNITEIGVVAHEISHAFGAADFYDVNYATGGQYDGTGNWDLMASGSWNESGRYPAHHNMYQKIQYGWVKPEVLENNKTIKDMPSSTDKPVTYIVNTTTEKEYFLIENIQQTKFNKFVPGHGLLIYRVHKDIEKSSRTINTTHPQRIYPVCSSSKVAIPTNNKSSYGAINGTSCAFPGNKKIVAFTDETIPSMQSWAAKETNKPITNIVENEGLMSFDFMWGDSGTTQYMITLDKIRNGSITVANQDKEILSGSYLLKGAIMTVITNPNSGYVLDSLKVNNELVISNTITVDKKMTIGATFKKATINVNTIDSNSFKVFANNNTITIQNNNDSAPNIDIIDMSGRVVNKLKMEDKEMKITIDKTGIYVVKITNNESINTYKVIIKNR